MNEEKMTLKIEEKCGTLRFNTHGDGDEDGLSIFRKKLERFI